MCKYRKLSLRKKPSTLVTWSIKSRDEEKQLTLERNVLRKIHGPTRKWRV